MIYYCSYSLGELDKCKRLSRECTLFHWKVEFQTITSKNFLHKNFVIELEGK